MKQRMTLFAFIVFCFSGCAVKQTIRYNLKDVGASNKQALSGITLDVEPLADLRSSVVSNEILFKNNKEADIDNKKMCINSEKNYKAGDIGNEISVAIVEHFKKRNAFKAVLFSEKASSDYYLTGEVKQFFGKQEFSTGALVGAQFGIVGAIATANAKTAGEIKIELSNMQIHNTNGAVIKDLGSISKEFTGEFHADAYCWCIYLNTNEKLKEIVSDLCEKAENCISSAIK